MKRVLMVAFHFPPYSGGSGIQRTLRFVQQLPAQGWQPLVLSAGAGAYPQTSVDLLAEIPGDTVVQRAFALDASRQLALKGRYLGWTARPDRWMSWRWDAVRVGMKMIAHYKPDVIWSTYPIATAHQIGAELQRRRGLPWVADFRDPMAREGYPGNPATWQSFKKIEETAFRRATRCVFTTPGAAQMYRDRYPHADQQIAVIENGYDEESFSGSPANDGHGKQKSLNAGRVTLLHSGIVYPSERDPTQLFQALAQLKKVKAGTCRLTIRFRAPVHESLLLDLAQKHGVQDMVEVLPAIDYRGALLEMCQADVLLLMQAANCDQQIPAKFYEYLRAGRPVLGLTSSSGDTAAAMRTAGLNRLARLDSADDIAQALERLMTDIETGSAMGPSGDAIRSASRAARTREFSRLLQSASKPNGPQ